MQGSMSHDSGARQQRDLVLQQIGGRMQQMAEQIKAGPLTPDQTLAPACILLQLTRRSIMLSRVATEAPNRPS
jgi:hypothetical protein